MKTVFLLISFVLLLSGVTRGTDFDIFCELVSLSPNKTTWCSNCSNPCGMCGVICNSDNTRIISISAYNKGLTTLPENISNLVALTHLWL